MEQPALHAEGSWESYVNSERYTYFRLADLLLLPLFAAVIFLAGRGSADTGTAVLIHTPDLEMTLSVSSDTIITVEGSIGPLTLQIKSGEIRIIQSPCRGQDCVRQGSVSSPGIPLVCIPSGVYVLLKEPETGRRGIDAVSY